MKIQVGGLSEGIHAFRFHSPPTDIGLPEEFQREVDIQATVEKTNGQFLLTAQVKAVARLECDRCLAPIQYPLNSLYRMWYVQEGGDTARADPAELQIIPHGLTVIDITEDVRQTVLLSVPLKHVCREDCRGLCPHCGKNLNEGACGCVEKISDSRWQGLRPLQNDSMPDQ
jgi:uncharacterized protein